MSGCSLVDRRMRGWGGGGACVGLMLMVRAGGRGAVSLYASLFSFLFKVPKDFGMGWDMAVGIRTNWE